MYFYYFFYVVFLLLTCIFFSANVAMMIIILSTIISGILLVRLLYKTTIEYTFVTVYDFENDKEIEVYDDYVYSNFLNAKVCKKSTRKLIFLFIITTYIFGILFWVIHFKPILWFFYIVCLLFGIILAFLFMKGEKEFYLFEKNKDMIHRKKGFKYIGYFTLFFLFGLGIYSVGFMECTSYVTDYITKNQMELMINHLEEKYGDGENFIYRFHLEECDLLGQYCEIYVYGYFESDKSAFPAVFIKDSEDKFYLKVIGGNISKEELLEIEKNSANKKIKFD